MMRWRNMGGVPPFSAILFLVAALFTATGGFAQENDVSELLDQGLTRFREGNTSEAVKLFEKAFSLEPTNDLVLDFIDRATVREMLKMVRSDDPQLSGLGRKLLELRRTAIRKRISDAEEVRKAVEETFVASPQERLALVYKHAALYGRNLVPYLVTKMGNPDHEIRAFAELWTSRIGLDAVPVLVAAAKHPDPIVRTSVAKLLGVKPIRHQFSAATLATLYETDKDSSVREAARVSLLEILRMSGTDTISEAKYYHYSNARMLYLNPHRNPFDVSYYEPTVYRLVGDQIEGEVVADFQLSERMAEQALEEALVLDPAFQEAWASALSNDVRQLLEYEEGLEVSSQISPDVAEVLQGQKVVMEAIRSPRVEAYPKEVLFRALGQALEDGMNEVAERLLEVIHRTERRGPVHAAVIAALQESSSRSVRIRAAIALASWSAVDVPVSIGEVVVGVLSEAVVNSGIRIAHKIMGNPENVNRFDAIFREINLESLFNTTSVDDGIVRASQLPPDILVIDDQIPLSASSPATTPINFFITQIRRNPRTSDVPLVVVVESSKLESSKDLYENPERKVLVVPDNIDAITFRSSVVDPLFESLEDPKARAVKLGSLAAEALERLTASPGQFPVSRAMSSLETVLKNRPDSIRIPCLRALGNLGSEARGILGSIAQLFPLEENSPEVRRQAMIAVGRILDDGLEPAPTPVLNIILAGMKESDLNLRRVSWFAYSAVRGPKEDHVQTLFGPATPDQKSTDTEDTAGVSSTDDPEFPSGVQ